MKICTKCKVLKSTEDFHKCVCTPDGLRYECKMCRGIYARAHYKSNPEHSKMLKRKASKKDREKYPDRISKAAKKYVINHPERCLIRAAKKRAELRGTEFSLVETDITIPEFCPILGIPLKKGEGKLWANSPTLDEIIPTMGYKKGNVQVISSKANTMKHNATPEELLRFSKWVQEFYGQ